MQWLLIADNPEFLEPKQKPPKPKPKPNCCNEVHANKNETVQEVVVEEKIVWDEYAIVEEVKLK